MSLRGAVTGSDTCTATASGPSNAVAGLADTLLGTASKTRSQLHDYSQTVQPGLPDLPGVRPHEPLSIDETVIRLTGPANQAPHQQRDGAADPLLHAFEQAFMSGQGAQVPAAPATLHAATHHAPLPPSPPPQVYQSLHHFLRTSLARHQFIPLQQPAPPALPLPDQLRIRDRGTILSRHLHADNGDAYADSQVASLLRGLGIEPSALPVRFDAGMAAAPGGNWDQAWAAAAQHAPPEPAVTAAYAADSMIGAHEHNWVDEFARMSMQHQPVPGMMPWDSSASTSTAGAVWAADFARLGNKSAVVGYSDRFAGSSDNWVDQFTGVANTGEAAAAGNSWAQEFSEQVKTRDAVNGLADGDAAKVHSKKLADVLRQDPQQRFQKSKFLQFVSKMSQGELEFRDGKLINQPQGHAWADDFAAGNETSSANRLGNLGDGWAEQFAAADNPMTADAWTEDFANRMIGQPGGAVGLHADAWVADFQGMQERTAEQEAFDHAWADFGQQHGAPTTANSQSRPYQFQLNNPFDGNPDALSFAQRAFKEGSLQDACLALEAVLKANPGDAQSWRLLATAHAENDNDEQAISAALRALDAAPSNAGVLLALGVSHVNELQQGEAVGYLLRWLRTQTAHAHALEGLPEDLSAASMEDARTAFRRAIESTPSDADLHTALGVLAHLAGDFTQATAAFEEGLRMRPEDYSLWNKLGATLANSGRSEAAKGAYAHALQHKPNYMRAWSNLGISYSNLGEYGAAAKYFLKSLTLNRGADSVWGYLQTAVVMMGNEEALQLVHSRDVDALSRLLGVATGVPGGPEPGMATAALAGAFGGVGQGQGALGTGMPPTVSNGFVEEFTNAFADGATPDLYPFWEQPGSLNAGAEAQLIEAQTT